MEEQTKGAQTLTGVRAPTSTSEGSSGAVLPHRTPLQPDSRAGSSPAASARDTNAKQRRRGTPVSGTASPGQPRSPLQAASCPFPRREGLAGGIPQPRARRRQHSPRRPSPLPLPRTGSAAPRPAGGRLTQDGDGWRQAGPRRPYPSAAAATVARKEERDALPLPQAAAGLSRDPARGAGATQRPLAAGGRRRPGARQGGHRRGPEGGPLLSACPESEPFSGSRFSPNPALPRTGANTE